VTSLWDARPLKYEVGIPDARCRAFIYAHHTIEPLSVGVQEGVMVVWGLVRPTVEPEQHSDNAGPRRLIVANTGAVIPDFPDGARFLGTVTTDNGIVWHIWDGDAETTA
jgi:hypothetical protein